MQYLTPLFNLLYGIESALKRQRSAWRLGLFVLLSLTAAHSLPAVSGNWYRSGNDMIYILPALRSAATSDLSRWLSGPWVGSELFAYYRPLTSAVWFAEFRAFGENAASWQTISLILHLATTLALAELLRRLSGNPLAALLGAAIWAMRAKIAQTLAWTPAQTDHFACFFAVTALLCFQIALDSRRRSIRIAGWTAAGLLALLALGSKEIALPIPLLAALLALRSPSVERRIKIALIAGCILFLAAFVAGRAVALKGVGFMPGQGSHSAATGALRSYDAQLTPQKWAEQMARLLLPQPLGPNAAIPVPAVLTVCAAIYLFRRFRSRTMMVATAIVGFAVSAFFIGGPDYYLLPGTYFDLAQGILSVGLVLLLIRGRPWDAAFCTAFGLITCLPLYHIVYNAAGNVTYLPGIYWAIIWTLLLSYLVALPHPSLSPIVPAELELPVSHTDSGMEAV